MSQAYSDPKRESDPHALPDLETFYVGNYRGDCPTCADPPADADDTLQFDHDMEHIGWYWQACFPGCLPDGDPVGPFATEAEALADARDGITDEDSDDNEASPTYEVIVGNIGCVYSGDDEDYSRRTFAEYVEQSVTRYGRAAGESVTLMRNGEPIAEHPGDAQERSEE